jgi:outer membrane protein TolC
VAADAVNARTPGIARRPPGVFGQVAESMYQLSTAADKEAAEQRSMALAEMLADLAWQGYRAGKADYLRVLSARRAELQAKLAYLEANRAPTTPA